MSPAGLGADPWKISSMSGDAGPEWNFFRATRALWGREHQSSREASSSGQRLTRGLGQGRSPGTHLPPHTHAFSRLYVMSLASFSSL